MDLRRLPICLAATLLACAACGEHGPDGSDASVEPPPPSTLASVEPPPTVVPPPWRGSVPADPASIGGWLRAFAYRGWAPQTDIRATGGHGGERLYFNPTLVASLQAGAAEHPVGSAAVRELYQDDLRTLRGFALMHKTAPTGPDGPDGDAWYWYEVFGTDVDAEPTVAGPGARGCVGCHSHAVDFVHSPDTPREDPEPPL